MCPACERLQISEGFHLWIYSYIDIQKFGYMHMDIYLSLVFPAYQVFQVSMGLKERHLDKMTYMNLHMNHPLAVLSGRNSSGNN